MHVVLPYPISANRYWISFYAPKLKRVCVGPTAEAKSYKSECGWLAKAAGIRQPLRGPVALTFRLVPKNGVCMDLDNALKVAIDALKGIAYMDDSQVRRIEAERCEPDGGKARLEVEVREIETAPLFRNCTHDPFTVAGMPVPF